MRKSFHIDWTKNGGYDDLMKTRSFVHDSLNHNYNLIHTYKPFYVDKPNTLYLQSKPFHAWSNKPSWRKIDCKTRAKWMKSTPCKKGTRKKIFLKYKSNRKIAGFGLYLFKLHNGTISKTKHIQFVKHMQTLFQNHPIQNENTEVDWFHVKDATV